MSKKIVSPRRGYNPCRGGMILFVIFRQSVLKTFIFYGKMKVIF